MSNSKCPVLNSEKIFKALVMNVLVRSSFNFCHLIVNFSVITREEKGTLRPMAPF